jgi:hypothetical protein
MELVDSVAAAGDDAQPHVTLSVGNGAGQHADVPWFR